MAFAVILCMVILTQRADAQSYLVTPVNNFFSEYRGKEEIIKKYVESRTDLNIEQRLALFQSEMNKLRDQYKASRKAEYESKSIELAVRNSCTSKSSGGKKTCGIKYVYAPIPELFTTQNWMRVVGTNKGTVISPDGSTAGLKMSVAGKGKNVGTLFAVYKYRPNRITELIETELAVIFPGSLNG
ncbi:hypothetical protein CLV57_2862 [Mucilaginibacter auburnensis]|uniref:Uncharacterized protein n=2 Tax=Mucilaginibacter auburnensis TaxID=1457233 RepID=A0A2H9VN24_9SPHI|nr:hypothetical protein CLV57_2862 [Mucilaginibacter auburnensis]